ncbi:gluconate:H+ symporter, GntP family [Actinobaculum suis]|uniref:Gluconate:H+ symporter, GntP family n=1 Tax=Actinobaculum suis TaxID=1657 RepID=A0A1G7ERQ4_9ACTO|nr:SLC13 family permease [Actinobaculum suis]MDY5152852.1 SLC13 family permease [Actinobaculum suis]SDE66341.1 gluconate:H+ symporter, GntP family [Actinobaculum suis]
MSAGALLAIAAVAVAILLLLVIKFKMSAFVGLLLVSLGTGLATGIPLAEIIPVMTAGMGKTLGSVMIVVGLGAMLGRVIEVAGGAESLAQYFTAKLGVKRVVAAVTIAAFILGIPVFFDVGFIILAPIVFGFAKVAKVNPLKIGLPVAGVMLTVHVVLPPHPGPVAAAGILGVDAGHMILVGLPLAALASVVGYFSTKLFRIDKLTLGDSPAAASIATTTAAAGDGSGNGTGSDSGTGSGAGSGNGTGSGAGNGSGSGGTVITAPRVKPPSALTVCALILLPILQIMVGTVGMMQTEEGTQAHGVFSFVGASPFALLVAVIVAYLVIGHQQRWDLEKRGSILDSALPSVAVIVFVTGAGGVFANVLVESGIGKALSDALLATNIPIILMGFVLAIVLRAAQGSATVAILTTAGLLAEPMALAGYTSLQATLVTIAMCFGGMALSHINDSGFWIVTKYLGLSVQDGLKSWTLLTTIIGVAGFVFTWLLFALV